MCSMLFMLINGVSFNLDTMFILVVLSLSNYMLGLISAKWLNVFLSLEPYIYISVIMDK